MSKFSKGTIKSHIVDVSNSYRPELRPIGIAYSVTVTDGDSTATTYMTAEEVFEKAMDMLRAYQRMTSE